MTGKIHSIETFGTVDGPGLRFVVFFQGCPMRCLYCHNPDTWDVSGATVYTADQIIDKMLRHRGYYKTGGITATGGEPMLQLDFLTELFKKAKENSVHTCLDTSAIIFNKADENIVSKVDELLNFTDLVMLDIKHIDDSQHKKLTLHSNRNVLDFAEHLNSRNIKMRIRHVIVPGITYNEYDLTKLGEFLKHFSNIEKIEILPYHTMGTVKYKKMGIKCPLEGVESLNESDAAKALSIVKKAMNDN